MDAEKNREFNAWLAGRAKEQKVVGEFEGQQLVVEVVKAVQG